MLETTGNVNRQTKQQAKHAEASRWKTKARRQDPIPSTGSAAGSIFISFEDIDQRHKGGLANRQPARDTKCTNKSESQNHSLERSLASLAAQTMRQDLAGGKVRATSSNAREISCDHVCDQFVIVCHLLGALQQHIIDCAPSLIPLHRVNF